MSATLFGSGPHDNPDPVIYHVEYAAVDVPYMVFMHHLRLCVDKFGDDVLVWAPFVGVAPAFRAAPGERAWRFCWRGTHSSPESFG